MTLKFQINLINQKAKNIANSDMATENEKDLAGIIIKLCNIILNVLT